MSQVNVTINGRQFRMACEDGQEGHLVDLAHDTPRRETTPGCSLAHRGLSPLSLLWSLAIHMSRHYSAMSV